MCQSDEQLRHNLTDFATLNTIQYETKLVSIGTIKTIIKKNPYKKLTLN
jgi:hypothetical protein